MRPASSAEKTVMSLPVLCRDGHFIRHLANRFDNMSNAAYIVNRQFQICRLRLAIQTKDASPGYVETGRRGKNCDLYFGPSFAYLRLRWLSPWW
jgi:hypothetical protein